MATHSGRGRQAREFLTVGTMEREISAGGVVLHQISGAWHVALIEPQKEESKAAKTPRKSSGAILALPKGLVDSGEKSEAAAIREVREETGLTAAVITKLADIKYVYVRTWHQGERVFKIVSFYLMRYLSGEIDSIAEAMRIEVKRAVWVPADQAIAQMAYSSERRVLHRALEFLTAPGEPSCHAALLEKKRLRKRHTDM